MVIVLLRLFYWLEFFWIPACAGMTRGGGGNDGGWERNDWRRRN